MKPIQTAMLCLLGASGLCVAAPPKEYAETGAAYKTEVAREDAALINPRFTGHLASSQAKRSARALGEAETDTAEAEGRRLARRGAIVGDGIDFASPQIFGTVRGDVNIVVERGAVRGSITSVRR